MADALVSIALEKLNDVLGQQLSLFAGATHELQKLKATFQSIHALLADAESRQVDDESVGLWLSRLRAAAYDIDDLLDDCLICGLEEDGRDDGRGKFPACLLSPCTGLDYVASRYKIARRITEVRERLDQINAEKNEYSFSGSSVGDRAVASRRPQTGSRIQEEMLGREKDKNDIIASLVSESSCIDDKQVRVIAVVGIGGQGKTTLVREIYNCKSLKAQFNLFSWVCVAEVFDVAKLTKAILDDLRVSTSTSDLNPLQYALSQKLEGKRFLLVLDDVWNEDEEKWNALRASFTSGAAGSRILVTTRAQKVANTMKAASIHELKGLSDDDSWRLFSNRAFAGRHDKDYSELEVIGKEIVRKCKGVPLSIKAMGSAMNCKMTVTDWQNILDSKMWSLPAAKSKILPALWLSYYNLPPSLRQCFAYCGIYEKDTVMYKEDLVKLWVAQGFVRPQGNRKIEDIGGELFDDLVAWSMFQEVTDRHGRTSCKIHDLLHDLAEHITKDETHIHTTGKSSGCHTNVRHASLSLSENNTSINTIDFRGLKTVRTLFLGGDDDICTTLDNLFRQARFMRALLFTESSIKTLPQSIGKLEHLRYLKLSVSWIVELPNDIGKMKYLKYLDLSNSELMELPAAIGELKNLRYLDLSSTKIVELPESVCHLPNLHTLKLNYCSKLKKLPEGTCRMVGLRNLKIKGTNGLKCLPKGLGRISSLTTLSKFIVGGDGGCKIDELHLLNSLQGSLRIQNLESVSSREEARKAELWNKRLLQKLVLEVSGRNVETERMDSALEELRPHENLEKLELYCNKLLSKLPSWMEGSSLSKLTELKIQGFIHCEQNNLLGLGKFPHLKSLEIGDVGVKSLGYELYFGNNINGQDGERTRIAFPKLERLVLMDMFEWEKWEFTSEVDANVIIMPSLHFLRLQNCPKLERLPLHITKAPLSELCIVGCHEIKGRGCCSSFPLLENFTLNDSSEFLSIGLPHLPKIVEFYIQNIRNETLVEEGWELLVALQRLQIVDCIELKFLPEGLRHLQSLENLVIQGCQKLESLPEGLGQLKKMKSLRINYAEALACLPNSLGQLESLEDVNIDGLKKLLALPEGLFQSKRLKSFKISNAEELLCLPDSLAQSESIENLHMVGLKKLQSLPEGLGQLQKLKSFKISRAEALTRLPQSLSRLESLECLDMDGLRKLQSLPEEWGQFRKLKSLKLGDTEEASAGLPSSLAQLESLETLEIVGWTKLVKLPHWLGQLKKLNSLVIKNMEALTCPPDSLGLLESLKYLNISHCNKLKSLPRGFGTLKSLTINHLQAWTWAPDMPQQLQSLEDLTIIGWKELDSLPHWLRRLKMLKRLTISECPALRSLPDGLQGLPLLRLLTINACPLLSERYKREEGEDWSKISRIPWISIYD